MIRNFRRTSKNPASKPPPYRHLPPSNEKPILRAKFATSFAKRRERSCRVLRLRPQTPNCAGRCRKSSERIRRKRCEFAGLLARASKKGPTTKSLGRRSRSKRLQAMRARRFVFRLASRADDAWGREVSLQRRRSGGDVVCRTRPVTRGEQDATCRRSVMLSLDALAVI